MKTDAKIYGMISDLSDSSLNHLMCRHGLTVADGADMVSIVRDAYEAGTISAEEIIDAWEDEEEV
jgi:hypothetical protein